MCIRDSNNTYKSSKLNKGEIGIYDFGTIKPVSYTHLDVYKRQVLNGTFIIFFNFIVYLSVKTGFPTLLCRRSLYGMKDVYKRQPQKRANLKLKERICNPPMLLGH